MELTYETERMRKLCTDNRAATRNLTAPVARAMATRIKQLENVDSLAELVGTGQPGRWHELTADRAGCVAARLTGNWRLIVRAGDDRQVRTQ